MAPPRRRSRPPLPHDAVFEILLRLPAKDLCRLRAVCRRWRSLLSDPHFIAAHAASHPGPHIVAGYHPSGGVLCDIMDLSGRLVKRIPAPTDDDWVMSAQLDLIYTIRGPSRSCRLLNPATGAVLALPEELAEEHAGLEVDIRDCGVGIAFGQLSTGEYKVLRVLHNTEFSHYKQLCEVITIGGGRSDARWRGKKPSPDPVDVSQWSIVAVNGVAYLFTNEVAQDLDIRQKRIASFDLATEEWRATLRGPPICLVGDTFGVPGYHIDCTHFLLAALNGCLAVVHSFYYHSMDLWFLMDFEEGLWVKQHSIQIESSCWMHHIVRPVLVLGDGRIVAYTAARGLLSIYDPRTNTCTDLAEIEHYSTIGLYTGNLLSLANGAS
ncbi:hypothetical protein ACP70R_022667 [Stipagrostis hirtigluma subsp. patula]